MTSYFVPKKTMEINPKQSIVLELTKNAAADKSDQTVQDLIWLLFDSWLFTFGFNLDEDPGDIEDGYEQKMCEEVKADFEPLTETMMEVLGDKTEEVMVSSRIAYAPCFLTTSERAWTASKHGAHHEGPNVEGQLHDIIDGVAENHGNQSKAIHHFGAQEESGSGQIRSNCPGRDLAIVRLLFAYFWLQPGRGSRR